MQDRDHDRGERAAGDVAGSHQHTGTLVGLGYQFLLAELLVLHFLSQVFIDQQTNHSAQENRAGRRERQINPNRERQRRNSAHLQNDCDHHTQKHQTPRQLAVQNALDDIGHQRGLGRVVLDHCRSIGPRFVNTVDTRIGEINRRALIVHEVTSRRAARGIRLVIRPVQSRVGVRLWPLQFFRRPCLGRIDL